VCARGPLPKGATRVERMKRKLLTKAGAAIYAARKGIVVGFGIPAGQSTTSQTFSSSPLAWRKSCCRKTSHQARRVRRVCPPAVTREHFFPSFSGIRSVNSANVAAGFSVRRRTDLILLCFQNRSTGP
jgi:hypothetical protein